MPFGRSIEPRSEAKLTKTISQDGAPVCSAIGRYTDAAGTHAFVYADGTSRELAVPGASSTTAVQISDAGQILVRYDDGAGRHWAVDDNGTFTTLAVPGASGTTVQTNLSPAGGALPVIDAGQVLGSVKLAFVRFAGPVRVVSPGGMTMPAEPSDAAHRFPAEIISDTVWLYLRFPRSLRHGDELLAARGIVVGHQTVRQWGLTFGQAFANRIRRRRPRAGDQWHLDAVEAKIAGKKHGIWRAVDRDGLVLDILVHSRRDKAGAKRLVRKRPCRAPGVTDKRGHGQTGSRTNWPATPPPARSCPGSSTPGTTG